MEGNTAEYVGYIASAVLIISFLMKDLKTIRIINLFGCLTFVLYGFLLVPKPAYPIIITNLVISGIQLYYLVFKK